MENKLPPLPNASHSEKLRSYPRASRDYFTADQMPAYASAAVLQERERWHKLMCEICDLSDYEMADGDRARDLAAKAMGFADYGDYWTTIRKPSPPPQDSHNGCG
jgi:rubredoxin